MEGIGIGEENWKKIEKGTRKGIGEKDGKGIGEKKGKGD